MKVTEEQLTDYRAGFVCRYRWPPGSDYAGSELMRGTTGLQSRPSG